MNLRPRPELEAQILQLNAHKTNASQSGPGITPARGNRTPILRYFLLYITSHTLKRRSNQYNPVKPSQTQLKPSITHENSVKPSKTQSNPVKPNKTKKNPVKPNKTKKNPVKPSQT